MFNPASCVFCDKLFTLPLGGVISAYGAVCNGCKTKALTETDSSHEIEADRPDPTESYGFDEDWQDTMKSDSAFERAFALLKMPYHGTNEETAKKILRHGTRAFRDKRPTFKRDPARFWMTSNPKEAMRHARSKGARGGQQPKIPMIGEKQGLADQLCFTSPMRALIVCHMKHGAMKIGLWVKSQPIDTHTV